MKKWLLVFLVSVVIVVAGLSGCGSKSESSEKTAETKAKEEAIQSCVGKTAKEAYETSEENGYSSSFSDKDGADVKSLVRTENGEFGEAKDALVTSVETSEGLFFSRSAHFTLDYTRPSDEELETREHAGEFYEYIGKTVTEANSMIREFHYSDVIPQFYYKISKDEHGTIDCTIEARSDLYQRAWSLTHVIDVYDDGVDKYGDHVVRFIIDRPIARSPEDDDVLAQILTTSNPSQESIEQFNKHYPLGSSALYSIHTDIEFDGCVVDCKKNEAAGNYDYEIRYGDFPWQEGNGPVMRFTDAESLGTDTYNATSPAEIGEDAVGKNYRFYVASYGYDPETKTMELRPQYVEKR